MKTSTLLMVSSAMALSLLSSVGFFVSSSFAQENMTTATNETGGTMGIKRIKQEEMRPSKDHLNN